WEDQAFCRLEDAVAEERVEGTDGNPGPTEPPRYFRLSAITSSTESGGMELPRGGPGILCQLLDASSAWLMLLPLSMAKSCTGVSAMLISPLSAMPLLDSS